MAIIEGQKINVRWRYNNRNHFLKLGYEDKSPNDILSIPPEHLVKSSNKKVKCSCDNCKEKFELAYVQANQHDLHFCSDTCRAEYEEPSEDFLISEYYRFYDEKNRHPHMKDMTVKNGYPSNYQYIKIFGSWSNFIKKLDIYEEGTQWLKTDIEKLRNIYANSSKEEIMNSLENDFSWEHICQTARRYGLKRKYKEPSKKALERNFLISEFWRYVDEFNRIPYMKEITTKKGYPSERGYHRIWGSWHNFLKSIDIIREDCTDGWYVHDEEVVKRYYGDRTKTPEYIIDKLIIKRKWDSIKRKAGQLGIRREKGIAKLFTKDFLISELRRYYDEYNRVPTHEEFADNKDFPSAKVMVSYFDTWNKAISSAGLDENLIRFHNKEDVIKELQYFYEQYGRSPYMREFKYSSTVIYNYWESWNDMLFDCGLPATKVLFGEYTRDQNGYLHRSKTEALITNVFINNDVNYTMEEEYKKYVSTSSSEFMFDWTIKHDGSLLFVEYFGMANSNSDRHEIISYNKTTLDKIRLCQDNNLLLIPIFNKDLNNNFKGLISKFEEEGISLSVEDVLYKDISFS